VVYPIGSRPPVASGSAVLALPYSDGTVALFVDGSLVKAHHEPHWGNSYVVDIPLSWNAASQTEQTKIFAIAFANKFGAVQKTVEKSESFACNRISVNPEVAGGAGGGFVQVNAAQLPKSMKGATAGFPLSALTGGRAWRLEVCPQGQSGAACKTTDFRITAFGAQQGEAVPPKPAAPAAKVFIMPGAAN